MAGGIWFFLSFHYQQGQDGGIYKSTERHEFSASWEVMDAPPNVQEPQIPVQPAPDPAIQAVADIDAAAPNPQPADNVDPPVVPNPANARLPTTEEKLEVYILLCL